MVIRADRGFPYFDPDYETLKSRIDPPRIVIDNAVCEDATVIKLDSVNRHGILLEVVEVLANLDLFISKAYISSDGLWFMDVFHVKDRAGNKILDPDTLKFIEQTLQANSCSDPKGHALSVQFVAEYTAIELCGAERPGLFSEIFEALTRLNCNVEAAEFWTHKTRAACVIFVNNEETEGPIDDPEDLKILEKELSNVMKGNSYGRAAGRTNVFMGLTHAERRLHKMMSADCMASSSGNYKSKILDGKSRPMITVRNCAERDYLVVTVQCKDRKKLMFDIVCALTDMEFMIFHATVASEGFFAYEEFYIRHIKGHRLDTELEHIRVISCLEAAIERRAPQGLRLEIRAPDRFGLLSDLSQILTANELSVTRADVSTDAGMAVNTFYVTDSSGSPVDRKIIESLNNQIGQTILQVSNPALFPESIPREDSAGRSSWIADFLRTQSERLLLNLGLSKHLCIEDFS